MSTVQMKTVQYPAGRLLYSRFFFFRTPLKFKWDYPDLAEMDLELASIRDFLGNVEPAMEIAKQFAIADMKMKFETETDTRGRTWEPWAEGYQATAESENVGILRRSDETLYYDAIDPSSYDVTPTSLIFNTSGLPDYWVFHDQPTGGAQRIPARTFSELTPQAIHKIAVSFDSYIKGGIALKGRKRSGVLRSPVGEFTSMAP